MRHDLSTYTQTFSGGIICAVDPDPADIRIEDIAHALALQCRYGGHVRAFYSVAQHSVHVSEVCPPGDALWGLLHDASEAYIADICRPVKKYLGGYLEAEARLMAAVCQRFGLPEKCPASVKDADDLLLRAEANALMAPLAPNIWSFWPTGETDIPIDPWPWEEAERRFLARFSATCLR